jgi:hypothetical protein
MKGENTMKRTGYFKKMNENGEVKKYRNVTFESTGIAHPYENNHKIWRKINKDGTPSNVFAVQFQPSVPWAFGSWFCMIDGGWVLENYPQLKVKTERSKGMTDSEYIAFLSSQYYG